MEIKLNKEEGTSVKGKSVVSVVQFQAGVDKQKRGASLPCMWKGVEEVKTHEYYSARNKAAHVVCKMVRKGELIKLSKNNVPCVDCGSRAVHYEHRDYGYPREVVPVCQRCNASRGEAKNTKMDIPRKSQVIECFECGYEWIPRVDNPKKCPECQFRFPRKKGK